MPRPARALPACNAMIVAPEPEAVEAGQSILAAGGSAVDAVLACAFTQGVVDPLMCGIGGLGSMQVFDPSSGRACRARRPVHLSRRLHAGHVAKRVRA